jgi:hypothetical protein
MCEGSRSLVHEDESVYRRPIRSRMLIATVQRLDPGNPEMSINLIFGSVDGKEGKKARCTYHLLRHCWPFRLCPIRAATSAQDIPAILPPCWDIIDLTIAVNSSTS